MTGNNKASAQLSTYFQYFEHMHTVLKTVAMVKVLPFFPSLSSSGRVYWLPRKLLELGTGLAVPSS